MYTSLHKAHLFRSLSLFPVLLLYLGLNAFPIAAAPRPQANGTFLSDEVLVKFAASVSPGAVAKCLRAANATRIREFAQIHVSRLHIPSGGTTEAIARLQSCPGVDYAERNYPLSAVDTIPNDSSYASQYGLVKIRAAQGWDLSTGTAEVTIAVIDSGIDLAHVDLSTKIVAGYDFINSDTVAQDDFGHGTHVAGIAAALTNNNVGIAGVSWGARLMPVKVLDSAGNGDFGVAEAGILWAADHGAQVINMSFGGVADTFPQSFQDAVDYAYGRGVLLVAAAGNDASNEDFYPAALAHVISVTATNSSNLQASFSNFGPSISLAAPGVSIYSTLPGNSYGMKSGTSMAAPFVSGLASILWSLPGNASPDQIIRDLESTALDLGSAGRDDTFGYGLIQVDGALQPLVSLIVGTNGSGMVRSSPPGIKCGAACETGYPTGGKVTLTAVPITGSRFLGWSDPACPASLACTLILAANERITANFAHLHYLPFVVK